MTNTNPPAARGLHTGVWSGSSLIVWGGYNGAYLKTGGRYNLANNNEFFVAREQPEHAARPIEIVATDTDVSA